MVARRKSKIMRGIVRSVEMGRNALNEELAALPSEQRRKVEAAFKAAIVADQAKANIGHDVEKLLQSVRGEMQRNRPAPPASPAA